LTKGHIDLKQKFLPRMTRELAMLKGKFLLGTWLLEI
jgi:hypothetical protein